MAVPEQNLVVAEINNYPEVKFNRLFPCTLTQLSPLHKVMVNVVQIDPDSESDVYDQKSGRGVSLTKISCLKLMTAANVIMEESKPILPSACQRCVEVARMTKTAPQCGGCPTKQDVAYQISILVPEPSGGYRRYVATKEVNKANYKGLPEHMAAQCETKALLRALRAGLGIKGSYTKTELKKPFAVALVVLNTTDPELKAALISRYAAGRDALFSAPQAQQLPAGDTKTLVSGQTVDLSTGEVLNSTEHVTSDDDEPPTLGTEAPSFDLPDDEPPTPKCQDCGEPVQAWKDNKQKEWSIEDTVTFTQEKLKGTFCHICAFERIKALAQQRKGA